MPDVVKAGVDARLVCLVSHALVAISALSSTLTTRTLSHLISKRFMCIPHLCVSSRTASVERVADVRARSDERFVLHSLHEAELRGCQA